MKLGRVTAAGAPGTPQRARHSGAAERGSTASEATAGRDLVWNAEQDTD